jgi:hypothetical protein
LLQTLPAGHSQLARHTVGVPASAGGGGVGVLQEPLVQTWPEGQSQLAVHAVPEPASGGGGGGGGDWQ